MPTKQTVVQISGLSQQPNDLSGVAPGSMQVADNVVMRRPGELSPAPKLATLALTTPVIADYTVLKSMADDMDTFVSSIVVDDPSYNGEAGPAPSGALVGQALQVQDVVSGTNAYYKNVIQRSDGGSADRRLAFFPGRSNSTFSRDRRVFSCERSPVTWTRNTADTDYELRLAGLQAPGSVTASGSTSAPLSGAVVAADTKQAYYRATFYRKYPKYELESSPTAEFLYKNASGVDNFAVAVIISWDKQTTALQLGDTLIVYRTSFFDSNVNPGGDFKVAARVVVDNTALTNGFVGVHDVAPDNALGPFLYTNTNQEGATQTNSQPPDSRCVATFNDTTFYAANTDTPTMQLGINDFGSINAGATVGLYTTSNGNNVTSGDTFFQVPGDVTSVIQTGMVVSAGTSADGGGLISSLSFAAGFTTIVLVAGAGLTGHLLFTALAGTHGIFISDAIAFTYTLYNNTTTSSTYFYRYSNPYFVPFDLNDSSVHDTFGVNIVSVSTNRPSTPTDPSVVFGLSAAQTGRIRSFSVTVTHPSAYTQLDAAYGLKNSVQNTSASRVYFSKTSLPESVPPVNFFDVGHGTILRFVTDNNNLYALCSDGLYRISGVGNDWQVTQISRTSILVHPDAVATLNGQVFAWFTEGVCAVSPSGAKNVSSNNIGPSLDPLAKTFMASPGKYWTPSMSADPLEKELWLFTSQPLSGTGSPYILNLQTGNWFNRSVVHYACGAYVPQVSKLYFPGNTGNITTGAPLLRFESDELGWENSEVRPNLFTAGAPGVLKQWVDMNLLIAREIVFFNEDSFPDETVQFLFENDAAVAQSSNFRYSTARSLQREHCWVPKRCAVQDTLKAGFVLLGVDHANQEQSVNFRLQGFVLRYRVASQTFQK